MLWERDEEPDSATFAAVEPGSGAIVGVATTIREPAPFGSAEASGLSGGREVSAWRLRGMATREDLQGQGIGSLVLEALVGHVTAEGGELLWCNARVRAIAFYERAGFQTWGEEWDIPSIGPHVVMWRRIGETRHSD